MGFIYLTLPDLTRWAQRRTDGLHSQYYPAGSRSAGLTWTGELILRQPGLPLQAYGSVMASAIRRANQEDLSRGSRPFCRCVSCREAPRFRILKRSAAYRRIALRPLRKLAGPGGAVAARTASSQSCTGAG